MKKEPKKIPLSDFVSQRKEPTRIPLKSSDCSDCSNKNCCKKKKLGNENNQTDDKEGLFPLDS